MSKLYVDYAQYHQLIDQVIANVQDDGFQPDWVLGVSRGGLFLADGLSRALRCPMAVIAATSYGAGEAGEGTVQGVLRVSASVACVGHLAGRVLLVDDLADSGHTLEALVHHVRANYPAVHALKTAVVWVKPHSVFKPDFAAHWMTDDAWIVQPFEVRDFDGLN
ncbi:MAG TPA: phosphoribosyltransferase family protein [Limnobacter sp.]|uniref:phosphoribosyltransferase n=1 Tax=Limnobacter sp. TaxID=2003368 RepID=UPI002EDA1A47